MKSSSRHWNFLFFILLLLIVSCQPTASEDIELSKQQLENEKECKAAMEKHLTAVKNKDLIALKSTMSPDGEMELIQPGLEIIYTVDSFMRFHEEWFEIPDWTVNTEILSMHVGNRIGVATTEFLYKEPERNGKPYFNRLSVTYTLEKKNGEWVVIKDHACSIEKTKSASID